MLDDMTKRPLHNNDHEIDRTIGGRLISAAGSLFFSVPLCLIVGVAVGGLIPMYFWVWPIGFLAVLGFFAPKFFPDFVAGLFKVIVKIADWSRFW
jgi:hypothetical protein